MIAGVLEWPISTLALLGGLRMSIRTRLSAGILLRACSLSM